MAEFKGFYPRKRDEECDVKVWSGACQRDSYESQSEKYLCSACGNVPASNHQMQHDPFPYLNGNDDELS